MVDNVILLNRCRVVEAALTQAKNDMEHFRDEYRDELYFTVQALDSVRELIVRIDRRIARAAN